MKQFQNYTPINTSDKKDTSTKSNLSEEDEDSFYGYDSNQNRCIRSPNKVRLFQLVHLFHIFFFSFLIEFHGEVFHANLQIKMSLLKSAVSSVKVTATRLVC